MQVSNLKVLKKIMYEQLITCDLRDLDAAFFSKERKTDFVAVISKTTMGGPQWLLKTDQK